MEALTVSILSGCPVALSFKHVIVHEHSVELKTDFEHVTKRHCVNPGRCIVHVHVHLHLHVKQ